MGTFLTAYAYTLVTLLVLDGVWIGLIARSFYAQHLGHLLSGGFAIIPAVCFYLLYAAGIVFFVVQPHAEKSLMQLFLIGAFFRLIAYGAYDFTNQATLRDWPIIVTLADLAWGAFMSGTAAVVVAWLLSR